LLCSERRNALVAALDRELGATVRVLGDQAGMFLTASLPDGQHDREIGLRAAQLGVRAMPLSVCYLGKHSHAGLILGYRGFEDAGIDHGVARLREAIGDGARAAARNPRPRRTKSRPLSPAREVR